MGQVFMTYVSKKFVLSHLLLTVTQDVKLEIFKTRYGQKSASKFGYPLAYLAQF